MTYLFSHSCFFSHFSPSFLEIWCGLLCLIPIFGQAGGCLLPYCFKWSRDRRHLCPKCKHVLHTRAATIDNGGCCGCQWIILCLLAGSLMDKRTWILHRIIRVFDWKKNPQAHGIMNILLNIRAWILIYQDRSSTSSLVENVNKIEPLRKKNSWMPRWPQSKKWIRIFFEWLPLINNPVTGCFHILLTLSLSLHTCMRWKWFWTISLCDASLSSLACLNRR